MKSVDQTYRDFDITGQIFGQVKVLSRVPRHPKDTHARWQCKCLTCSSEFTQRGQNIRKSVKDGKTLCRTCFKATDAAERL